MIRTLLAAAAALALGACASAASPTEASAPRDCFRAVDVNGWGVQDAHRVRVSVGASRQYYLTIGENTGDLDWTQALALRSPSSFICTGDGVTGVQIVGGDLPRRYMVTRIERAPDEAPQGS